MLFTDFFNVILNQTCNRTVCFCHFVDILMTFIKTREDLVNKLGKLHETTDVRSRFSYF